jgi:hypothetical protein
VEANVGQLLDLYEEAVRQRAGCLAPLRTQRCAPPLLPYQDLLLDVWLAAAAEVRERLEGEALIRLGTPFAAARRSMSRVL